MKPETPFSCKHCGNTEKHDRRVCHGRVQLKALQANPEWSAKMRKRNSQWLKDKWDKVQQAEKESTK